MNTQSVDKIKEELEEILEKVKNLSKKIESLTIFTDTAVQDLEEAETFIQFALDGVFLF